jgi:chromosome transmission fidelity protein 18
VLDQEYQKNIKVRENAARQARYKAGNPEDDVAYKFSDDKENKDKRINYDELPISTVKKDFFGRILVEEAATLPLQEGDGNTGPKKKTTVGKSENKVWVTFHEGFSNAVRKPVTVEELLRGL